MCDSDNDINLWLDLEEGEISQEEFERRMYGIEYKETYWEDDSETIQMEDYLMQENECDKNIGTNELEQAFINKLYEDTKTDKILWTGLFCDKHGKNKLVDKCIDKIIKRNCSNNTNGMFKLAAQSCDNISKSNYSNDVVGSLFILNTSFQSLEVLLVTRYFPENMAQKGKNECNDAGQESEIFMQEDDTTVYPDISQLEAINFAVMNNSDLNEVKTPDLDDIDILDVDYEEVMLLLQEIYRQLNGKIISSNRDNMIAYLGNMCNRTKPAHASNYSNVPDEEIPF